MEPKNDHFKNVCMDMEEEYSYYNIDVENDYFDELLKIRIQKNLKEKMKKRSDKIRKILSKNN